MRERAQTAARITSLGRSMKVSGRRGAMASPPALFLNPGALVVRQGDSGGASDDNEEDLNALEEFDNEEATGWPQQDPYLLLHTFTKEHNFPLCKRTGFLQGKPEKRVHKFENDRAYVRYVTKVLSQQPGFRDGRSNDWSTFNVSTERFATDRILKELLYTSENYRELETSDVFLGMLGNRDGNELRKRPVYLLDGSNMFHTQDANGWTRNAQEQSNQRTFNPDPSGDYKNAAGATMPGKNVTGFERYFEFDQDPGHKVAMYLKRRSEARRFFLSLLRRDPTITKTDNNIEFRVSHEHYVFEQDAETPTIARMRSHFLKVHDGLNALQSANRDVYSKLERSVLDQSRDDAPAGPVVVVINEKSYNNILNKWSREDVDKKMVRNDADKNGELRHDKKRHTEDIAKVYFNTRDRQGKSLFYRVLETTAGLHKWSHPVVFSINDELEVNPNIGNNSNRDIGGNHSMHDNGVSRFVFHHSTPENPSQFAGPVTEQHQVDGRPRRTAVAGKFVTEESHDNKEWDDALLSRVRDRLDRLGISAHSISDDKNVYKTDHPCLPMDRCADECLYPVAYDKEWQTFLEKYHLLNGVKADNHGTIVRQRVKDAPGGERVPISDDCDRVFDLMTILSQRMSRRPPSFMDKNPRDDGVNGLRNWALRVHPYFTGTIRALQAEDVRTYPWTPYYGVYCVSKNTGLLNVGTKDSEQKTTVAEFVQRVSKNKENDFEGPVRMIKYPELDEGAVYDCASQSTWKSLKLAEKSVLRGDIMRERIAGAGIVVDFDRSEEPCKPDAPTDDGADPRNGVRWVMEHRRHLLLLLRDLASSAEAIANGADALKPTLSQLATDARAAADAHASDLKQMAMAERTRFCRMNGVLRLPYVEQQREKHRRMRVLDKMRSTVHKGRYDSFVETPQSDAVNSDPRVATIGMIQPTAGLGWNFVFRMYHGMCERHDVPYEDRYPFEVKDSLEDLATVIDMPITATSRDGWGRQVDAPLWYRDLRNWFAVYVFVHVQKKEDRRQYSFLFEEDDVTTGWPSYLAAMLGTVVLGPWGTTLRERIDQATDAVQAYYATINTPWMHDPERRHGPGPGSNPAARLAADTYRFA